MTEIIQLGRHRLLQGDSTDLEQVKNLMGGKKANLLLIDPPYGVDYVAKNAAVNGGIVWNSAGEIKQDSDDLETIKKLWYNLAKNAYEVTDKDITSFKKVYFKKRG